MISTLCYRVYSLDDVALSWTMVLWLWVTELRRARITGLSGTPGVHLGVRLDTSGWSATLLPKLASVVSQLSHLTLLRRVRTHPTEGRLVLTLWSPTLYVINTIPALRAQHAAVCMSLVALASLGDAALLKVLPAAMTTTAAALMIIQSAMLRLELVWRLVAYLFSIGYLEKGKKKLQI